MLADRKVDRVRVEQNKTEIEPGFHHLSLLTKRRLQRQVERHVESGSDCTLQFT